ncbi:DUF5677 domain-containing protein [Clostridium sp.]|uniref:DUF5677 domain-containing protein n=1 Tax=Clostridium sp. TaxID=1506 RepID=UPI00261269CA|nr:DUF5677 domain-containing protein [Clostridium sp.]
MELDIYSIIEEKCKEQFEFYNELEKYVERELLLEINNLKKKTQTEEEEKLEWAISLLISQGIKTYKSSIILIKSGYASNALIVLRSLIEVIFNIDYIFENSKFRYKRANNYLNNKMNDKVWKRAELSLNKSLYEIYKELSNFTHINFKMTCRNSNGSFISIKESEDMVKSAVEVGNGIYYYFVYIICEIYNINKKNLNSIRIPDKIKDAVDAYTTEKNVISEFMNILEENGVDKNKALEEFKAYKIKKEIDKKNERKKSKSKN